jgi:hypothetical protein
MLLVRGLENFTARVLGHALAGEEITEATLVDIKSECVRNLKNASVTGLPIEQETDALQQAIQDLEKSIDAAIAKGRQTENRSVPAFIYD